MEKNNEPEFIVSPEDLKKNQERAYAREYYAKKEKQDKIVTVVIIVLAIVMVVLSIKALNSYFKKDIDSCIKAGNTEYFCRINL